MANEPRRFSGLVTVVALLATVALTNCSPTPNEKQQRWKASYTAAECDALMQQQAFVQRCGNGNLERAIQLASSDIAECMPFSKPMRMHGLWENGFELSAFYPDAQTLRDISGIEPSTWLDAHDRDPDAIAAGQGAGELIYRVEFLGRKSLCKDHYGDGLFSNEVIADRFLTKVRLTPSAQSAPE